VGITMRPLAALKYSPGRQVLRRQLLEKSKLMVDIAHPVWDKARMFKRMQQLEISSGKAASASAVAVDGVALNANLSLILVLVLVIIPLASGVALIL
jgi:hypothetical protein